MLSQNEIFVRLVDTNSYNITSAKREGLVAQNANLFLDHEHSKVNLDGTGKLLALTANDEVNTLATIHFADVFSWAEVYQLSSGESSRGQLGETIKGARSRILFSEGASFQKVANLYNRGAQFLVIDLSSEAIAQELRNRSREDFLPLFVIEKQGLGAPVTVDKQYAFTLGSKIVALSLTPVSA